MLLLFHRTAGVVIDHATLTLGTRGEQHLLNDAGKRVGFTFDSAGERIATQGAESDAAHRWFLAGIQRHAIVINHDECTIALDYGPLGRVIQRNNRNLFAMDVLPNVEFGPVRNRKHPDTLAWSLAGVVEIPKFGSLLLWVPPVLRRPNREDPLGESVEGLRNLDEGYIPPVYEKWGGPDLLDGKRIVRPRESIEYTRLLAEKCGIFCGISAGAALAGAVRVASQIESGTIVFIVCDGGWKYLSTGAWTDDIDDVVDRASKIIYF